MPYQDYLDIVGAVRDNEIEKCKWVFMRWWILCLSLFPGLIVLLYVGECQTRLKSSISASVIEGKSNSTRRSSRMRRWS